VSLRGGRRQAAGVFRWIITQSDCWRHVARAAPGGVVRDESSASGVLRWYERMSVQEEGILRRGCACGDEEGLRRRFQSSTSMSSEWETDWRPGACSRAANVLINGQ
jgi:hypothetical protein